MKKLTVILIIIIISISISFATDNTKTQLNIESQQNNNLYVPFFDFLDTADIDYKKSPDSELSAYKDNMFMKFYPYSNIYYVNGKEFKWKNKPFYKKNNILYTDGNTFRKYFSIDYNYDPIIDKITVDKSKSNKRVFDNLDTYEKILIDTPKFYIFIPDYWEKLKDNVYGKISKDDTFTLTINKETVKNINDFDSYIQNNYIANYEESKDIVIMNKKKSFDLVKGIKITTYKYYVTRENKPEYNIFSFFKVENKLYTFKFESNILDQTYILDVVEKIGESISTGKYQLDTSSEHYLEYDAYKKYNLSIKTPLYANMCIKNYLPLEGSIDIKIKKINVLVKRGKKVFEDEINVVDGKFKRTVSIPFGLGLHSVSLIANNKLLVKTSVVNTSIEEGLYVASSKYIDKTNDKLDELLKNTKVVYTDYKNAKIIFENIRNEIEVADSDNNFNLALKDKKANEFDLNRIYLAALRKIRIPSRMVKDKSDGRHYVEFESNGIWIKTDIYGGVVFKEDEIYLYFDNNNLINEKDTTQLYY